MPSFELRSIGVVESSLKDPGDAPRQPDEGAPPAWLTFDPAMADALHGLQVGDEVVVVTWLHAGKRDVVRVHPRGDRTREAIGVFATRSPDRPNPIGLHQTHVTAISGLRVQVSHLEAIDGTPIIDL